MTPHCCPVCVGKGIVPHGFYRAVGELWSGTDTTPDPCRACHGQGVVWSPASQMLPELPELPLIRYRIDDGPWLPVPEYEVICEGQSCTYREKR